MRTLWFGFPSAAAAITLLAGCTGAGSQTAAVQPDSTLPSWAASYQPEVRRDLFRVRAATVTFQDSSAAVVAGYPAASECVAHPSAGGMGFHYTKAALLDDVLEVERPEILVYAPSTAGPRTLAGVEYVVPFEAWTHAEPPAIFGQNLKRAPRLGIWYLHVWTWQENEKGVFDDWNPSVRCG